MLTLKGMLGLFLRHRRRGGNDARLLGTSNEKDWASTRMSKRVGVCYGADEWTGQQATQDTQKKPQGWATR